MRNIDIETIYPPPEHLQTSARSRNLSLPPAKAGGGLTQLGPGDEPDICSDGSRLRLPLRRRGSIKQSLHLVTTVMADECRVDLLQWDRPNPAAHRPSSYRPEGPTLSLARRCRSWARVRPRIRAALDTFPLALFIAVEIARASISASGICPASEVTFSLLI
jgi:hypothetical protein